MNLNLSSLRAGFIDYLEKQNKINTSEENYTNPDDISIFMYANDFKEYLEQEENINLSDLTESFEDFLMYDSSSTDDDKDVDNNKNKTEGNNFLNDLFNDLTKDESFFNKIDTDKDGEINNSEKENFLNVIKNFDGNDENLSFTDILDAADSIKENKFDEITEKFNAPDTAIDVNDSSASSGAGSNYSGVNNNSGNINTGTNTNTENDKDTQEKPLDKMTKEELNTELNNSQSSLSEEENLLSSIIDGSAPELLSLNEEVEAAYEIYYNQLNDIAPEMAEQLQNFVDKLDDKDKEVSEQETTLAKQTKAVSEAEAAYEQAQNTVNSLETNLASLESVDRSKLKDEQIAELDAKIAATEEQLDAALEEAEEANNNIIAQKEKETEEKEKLEQLKAQYKEINEEKSSFENDLSENNSEIKEAMNNYNTLKNNYDSKKSQMLSDAKEKVQTTQNRINDIQSEIKKNDDKKNIKDNLSFKSTPDIFSQDVELTTEFIQNADDSTMPYLLIGPKNADENEDLPVLVYLHGSGEVGGNENSMRSVGPGKYIPEWGNSGLENFNGYIICPILPNGSWNNDANANKIDNILDSFKQNHSVNEDKIAIAGHSLGSFGALYIGNNSKTHYSKIAMLSGYRAGNINIQDSKVPVYGYVGSPGAGEDSSSYQYMTNDFAAAVGEENLHVYGTSHGGVPKEVLNEDKNGNHYSDFFENLFADEE